MTSLFSPVFICVSFSLAFIACQSNTSTSKSENTPIPDSNHPNTTPFLGETIQRSPLKPKYEPQSELAYLHIIEKEIDQIVRRKDLYETMSHREEGGDCYIAVKHWAFDEDKILMKNHLDCGEYGFTHEKYVLAESKVLLGNKLKQTTMFYAEKKPDYLLEQWLFDFREEGDSVRYYYRKKLTDNYKDTLFLQMKFFDTLRAKRKGLLKIAKEDWIKPYL